MAEPLPVIDTLVPSPDPRASVPRVAVVVPVFDERDRFAASAAALVEFVAGIDGGGELLFVDDGSTDGTPELVEALVAEHPDVNVRLLRRPHLGKGAAVTSGLQATAATVAAFCDLDLATPLSELARIVDAADRTEVLAIGSRDVAGSRLLRHEGHVRELLGRSYNRLLQATVTPGVLDTQCGAKAARRAVWDAILPHCRQSGFAWDAEAIAVALALGVTVQEVAIDWAHDGRSKVRVGRDGMRMVLATPAIQRRARLARRATRDTSRVARPATDATTTRPAEEVFDDTNAAALLAPDGRLVVNVPAHRWLWSAADEALGHRRRYSRSSLRADLRAAGLEAVLTTHVFSWLVAPVWAARLGPGRHGGDKLGLDRTSPWIERAAMLLTAVERQFVGRVGLPFGTSVLCVAAVPATSAPAA